MSGEGILNANPRVIIEILPPETELGLTPPLPCPLIVDDDGQVWIPHRFIPGCFTNRPLSEGIGMAWTVDAQIGKPALIFWGGKPDAPSDEVVVTMLSREGLRGLIRELQSIDDQLGAG